MPESQIVVAGALIRAGSLLVAQRARPARLAGLWELPGGKVEPGEDDAAALARELREELDLAVTVGERLGGDVEPAPGVILRAYRVRGDGPASPREHRALRWVGAAELPTLAWVPADRGWLPDLTAALTGH